MKSRSALLVGLVGLLLASAVALRVLSSVDGDPTIFVAFGEEALETRHYGEQLLGDVYLRASQGHDGKFFFVQANDPWLINPDQNAAVLDRPAYRSQRMLYPILASAGGLLSPDAIVWGLLVVNILAVGAGTFVVASLAQDMGGSAWWGLTFPLNLGFIADLAVDGSGIVSAVLAFLAVLAIRRNHFAIAVVSVALAGLAREAMLVAAAGLGLWLWLEARKREAVAMVVVPGAVAVLWALFVRSRMDFDSGTMGSDVLAGPFVGVVGSVSNWLEDPVDLLVGVAMLMLIVLYTYRALQSRHPIALTFLAFAPLGLFLSSLVWTSWFDISRALAPLLTVYVLLLFPGSASRSGPPDRGLS